MAIEPMKAKHLLYVAINELNHPPPNFESSMDNAQLWTSKVTITIGYHNQTQITKSFISPTIDSLPLAEDCVSRMALKCIRNYYQNNAAVTAYLNTRIYKHSKSAWKNSFHALQEELERTIRRNRKLCQDLYETKQHLNNVIVQHKQIRDFDKQMAESNLQAAIAQINALQQDLTWKEETIQYLTRQKNTPKTECVDIPHESSQTAYDCANTTFQSTEKYIIEMMEQIHDI